LTKSTVYFIIRIRFVRGDGLMKKEEIRKCDGWCDRKFPRAGLTIYMDYDTGVVGEYCLGCLHKVRNYNTQSEREAFEQSTREEYIGQLRTEEERKMDRENRQAWQALEKSHRRWAAKQYGHVYVTIYALEDPRTQKRHYVGQSVNPAARFKHHLNARDNRFKSRWMKELRLAGMLPKLVILEECIDEIASEREAYWIAKLYFEGSPLTNKQIPNPIFLEM